VRARWRSLLSVEKHGAAKGMQRLSNSLDEVKAAFRAGERPLSERCLNLSLSAHDLCRAEIGERFYSLTMRTCGQPT
jgi:hypothetical protein